MSFHLFHIPPEDYTDELWAWSSYRPLPDEYPRCVLCGYQIGFDEQRQDHHPDPERRPDWSEPAHADCLRKHHAPAVSFDQPFFDLEGET